MINKTPSKKKLSSDRVTSNMFKIIEIPVRVFSLIFLELLVLNDLVNYVQFDLHYGEDDACIKVIFEFTKKFLLLMF